MIGYLLEQGLENVMPDRRVATLLTQVVVDPADRAFDHPSKPIGPVYDREEAERLAAERGFHIAPDGAGYRRVVASPEPLRIMELESIRILLQAGVIVVCTGGGGSPLRCPRTSALVGVEAVIDKDLAAALLARELAPTSCCCSRMCRRWRSALGRRMLAPCRRPRRRRYAAFISPQDRWDRRPRRRPDSPRRAVAP